MKGPVLSVVLPEDMQDGTKLLIKNSPDMESKSASGDERLVSPHRDDDTDVAGESEDGLKGSLTKTSHDYEGMESSCEPSSSHPLSPSQDTIPSQSLDTIPNASLEEDSKPPSHSMSDFQPPGCESDRSSSEKRSSYHPASAPVSVAGGRAMPAVHARSSSLDDAVLHSRERPNDRTHHPPSLPSEVVVSSDVQGSPKVSPRAKQPGALRRGKWTVEEEAYVARVIQDFNSGFLDAPAGTTLRTYLSEKLQCDPMRITKKFTGEACIGKRVFHPAVRTTSNATNIDKAQTELLALEKRWRRRLELQQRESSRKAAVVASSAAAALNQGYSSLEGGHDPSHNAVRQTATWLERARSALSQPAYEGTSAQISDADVLQTQLNEVQRLINEGPIIQQSVVDLPATKPDHEDKAPSPGGSVSGSVNSNTEPADKRLRTAEDAEALVGFIRSVRASAAACKDL